MEEGDFRIYIKEVCFIVVLNFSKFIGFDSIVLSFYGVSGNMFVDFENYDLFGVGNYGVVNLFGVVFVY